MNLNELTIGQAREIAGLLKTIMTVETQTQPVTGSTEQPFTPHIGKPCIVRTYASGVFYGTVTKQDGRMVELSGCRRLWYWKASKGVSLSAVAVNGVDTRASKITEEVHTQTVLDAIEIIPASTTCVSSIAATPTAEAS